MIELLESRLTILIIVSIIISILLVSTLLLTISIIRRVKNSIVYRKIDQLKSYYRNKIYNIVIETGNIEHIKDLDRTSLKLNSLRGRAFIDILIELYDLNSEYINKIARMYEVDKYYVNRLKSGSSRNRLEAVKILTNLGFTDKFKEIIDTIRKEENSEFLYRMLFYLTKSSLNIHQIEEVIYTILDKYKKGKLSFKEMSVLFSNMINKLSMNEVGRLIELLNDEEQALMAFLDALYSSEDKDNIPLDVILNLLNKYNPEILSRALKVIAMFKGRNLEKGDTLVHVFLSHPVWYVRLNAVKALESFRCNRYVIKKLAELLYDDNWQVRSASAGMLVRCMEGNFDIILSILESKDEYAKQAIAEAISKSNAGVKLKEALKACDTEDLIYAIKITRVASYKKLW